MSRVYSSAYLPPLPQRTDCEIRHIPSSPGYAATNTGEIWSCRTQRRQPNDLEYVATWRRVSTQWTTRKDAKIVIIHRNKAKKARFVHACVLEAFIGPRPPGLEGCHYDGNPENNHLDNLRWDTRKGNMADARRHGTTRHGEQHHYAKLNNKDIQDIIALIQNGVLQKEVAQKYNVSHSLISMILQGKIWQHIERPIVQSRTKRLTVEDVATIKQLLAQGVPQTRIANRFNIDSSLVSLISKNKIKKWVHV